MQLGNKADLLEIGKAKRSETLKQNNPVLSQNDKTVLPPINTRVEIAKAAGVFVSKPGELLARMDMHGGDRKSSLQHASLKDLGISQTQSSRWQRAATVPGLTEIRQPRQGMDYYESKTCFQNHELQFTDNKTPLDCLIEKEEGRSDFLDTESIKAIPASALKDLIRFLLPPNLNSNARFRGGLVRLAIMAHLADVDDFGGMTLTEIASGIGMTRAAVSWHHCKVLDSLGLNESRSSKSREARKTYSRTATEAHRKQGHKVKADLA